MDSFNLMVDPYFVALYRLTGFAFVDFLLGTGMLALVAVMIGEACIGGIFLINRSHIVRVTDDVIRYRDVSMDALSAGDKKAYEASNKMANDAFGRAFFMQIAMSAAFLWPILFVAGWMQFRFADIEFRILFTEFSVGVLCPFVALYSATYLAFKRVKYRLPFFKNIKRILDEQNHRGQANLSVDSVP